MTPLEEVAAALQAGIDRHVVVVTGSAPLHPAAVAAVPDNALVLAADGGLDHALAAGLHPAGLVGDLDSVTPEGLAWATEHATIARHDPAKDYTDTELTLAIAVDLNPAVLTLIAGAGDRLDHTLAALGALGHASLTGVPVLEAWWGAQRIRVLHGPGRATFTELPVGTTISLLAAHGTCDGVGAAGVHWPLDQFQLEPLVGLGVSNVTTAPTVTVSVSTGVLTVFVWPTG
jgi:thiamine pyrophosphokinase